MFKFYHFTEYNIVQFVPPAEMGIIELGYGNRNSRNAESRKQTRSMFKGQSNEELLRSVLAIVTALYLKAPGSIPKGAQEFRTIFP